MALPGRTGRRGGGGAGFRWLAVGVVITLLVLLIDASLNSRSPVPQQQLAAGVWVDRVLPVIQSSNSDGQVLASVWANGLHMPASSVMSQVDQIATSSSTDYTTVIKLRPPENLTGPAGLLEAALLARSKAAGELQKAFRATLGSAAVAPGTRTSVTAAPTAVDPATVVSNVTSAGSEIQVGDQAYQLFLSSLPSAVGVRFPRSSWGSDQSPYAPQAAQVWLTTMQSTAATNPVYQVKIVGISTTPSPVATSGSVQVLPDASAITTTIVVADTGNQPANNLTITATISPAGSGSSSVRDFVNLAVGQAYTITALGPLNPPQGVPVTLTVTVTGPAGSSIPQATRSIVFQMPAPAASSTTTLKSSTTSTSTGSTTPPTT